MSNIFSFSASRDIFGSGNLIQDTDLEPDHEYSISFEALFPK